MIPDGTLPEKIFGDEITLTLTTRLFRESVALLTELCCSSVMVDIVFDRIRARFSRLRLLILPMSKQFLNFS